MNGDEVCFCGHVAEEHRLAKHSLHECEIKDCECICFDLDEEETAKARGASDAKERGDER